uniref:Uncharacterized protein n=1 Tax=Globisporangium ultimum (strain ATCC 200006 / CBS 805.95 / DAOM BR144) TaxID=431595 RepID=K3WBG1_GLOUD
FSISTPSVNIANGKRYGLFLYAGISLLKIKNLYGWETLISNACTSQFLLRWLGIMVALYRGYLVGGEWLSTGIGCLANFFSLSTSL